MAVLERQCDGLTVPVGVLQCQWGSSSGSVGVLERQCDGLTVPVGIFEWQCGCFRASV